MAEEEDYSKPVDLRSYLSAVDNTNRLGEGNYHAIGSKTINVLLIGRSQTAALLLIVILHAQLGVADLPQDATCGGYTVISTPQQKGTIISPNFPANYPPQANCIWLFQAPTNYSVQLHIRSMYGQADNTSGNCIDYLMVTNGSSTSTVLYDSCHDPHGTTLVSWGSWMWVKFFSGDVGSRGQGFEADWSVVPSNTAQYSTSPIVQCLSISYQCPNMECVSWSYVCDGINDCGYLQSGSDEIGCDGLGWSSGTKIGVGVGSGAGLFFIIFFGIGFIDMCIRERARRKYQKELERKRRLAKKKKAEAKAAGNLDASADPSRRGSGNLLATPGSISRQISSTSTLTN